MRSIIVSLLAFLLPISVFAAQNERPRKAVVDYDKLTSDCKAELGFSDAQYTRGSFIEMLQDCIGDKVIAVKQTELYDQINKDREEFVTKASKSFQARFRGKNPVTQVVRSQAGTKKTLKKVVRVSARATKAKAFQSQTSSASTEASSSSAQ